MIHNNFFPPYPLQAVLNVLRENLYVDKLIIKKYYKLEKNGRSRKIEIFDCDIEYEKKKKPFLIIHYYNKVYFTSSRIIETAFNHFVFLYGRSFDMNGDNVSLNTFIPFMLYLVRADDLLVGGTPNIIFEDIKKNDTLLRLNDEQFIAIRVINETLFKWNYEIDLNSNTAMHVISLREKRWVNGANGPIDTGAARYGQITGTI